jgi:uncharacterized membrane protein YqhA
MHASQEAKEKFRIRKSYAQMFKVLSQIAANMDQMNNSPLVARIIGLCDTMLHNLE